MINSDFIKAFASVINTLDKDNVCPLYLIDTLANEMFRRGYKSGMLMVAFADDFKAVKFVKNTASREPHTNIPLPENINLQIDFETLVASQYDHVQAAKINDEFQPILRLDLINLPANNNTK